mmetsp:Transcript_95583/g.276057  ORF Transcript_95583/g.276057 Transcript_95583/m.276057 type:complete len:235 (+) Transcript_95583:68-772(+)
MCGERSSGACPRAPRLSPAADPFDLTKLVVLGFALPPATVAQDFVLDGPCPLDAAAVAGDRPDSPLSPPRAPRLCPAADPVKLCSLPHLALPPSAADECDEACPEVPPAPRLKPAAEPALADDLPTLRLPAAALDGDEDEEDEEEWVGMVPNGGSDDDDSDLAEFEWRMVALDPFSEGSQREELEELDFHASPPDMDVSSILVHERARIASYCSTEASTPPPSLRAKWVGITLG